MKRRHGFTLVELLVSMALIIFLMAIISHAFVAALGTFRNLKAQGDMAEKLRAVTQILQHDLAADHFDGGRKLSDPTFWNNGPPAQGFFRLWQGSQSIAPTAAAPLPNDAIEGYDIDGVGSYRSTDHSLAFTIKLRGNDMGDFMSASAAGSGAGGSLQMSAIQSFGPQEARYQGSSGGAYNYQWAEVAWFLQPQVNLVTLTTDTTVTDPMSINPTPALPKFPPPSTPLPLFTLYRRQRLLVPDNNLVSLDLVTKGIMPPVIPSAQYANYLEMSCCPDAKTNATLYFNNPADITVPWRRFGMFPPNATNIAYQAGLLYGAIPPFALPYPPWTATWPPVVPPTPPPWGSWTAPSPTPPTYPLSPGVPPLAPIPSYPSMAQHLAAPPTLIGSDIQLTDVVSFDVRVYTYVIDPVTKLPQPLVNGNDPFVTLFSVPSTYQNNPAFYNLNTPPLNPNGPNLTAPAVFDTWTSIDDGVGSNYPATWSLPFQLTAIPLWNSALKTGPIIKAVQITIRIWDSKANQTRQVTIVQAM